MMHLTRRALLAAPLLASCAATDRATPERLPSRWSQRLWRGANCFARPWTSADFAQARRLGIRFLRIAPNIWPSRSRDAFIGNADRFTALDARDLATLKAQLDLATLHDLGIVLTTLSLPGARWTQHHGGSHDRRLYTEPAFRPQAADCWRRILEALGSHPALWAINLLNEPRPAQPQQAYELFAYLLEALRPLAPTLPILLDAAPDAEPASFAKMPAFGGDPHVLFGLHLYQPWSFVTWRKNKGRFAYPGPDAQGRRIDRDFLARQLAVVDAWQRRHTIAHHRVVLSEFGIDRRIRGAHLYLRDVIALAEQRRWHWAFYAFRGWQAMDYELGSSPPPVRYWKAQEQGRTLELPRVDSPLIRVLQDAL